jgi:ParB family transcriptional regulator, chromosome partitioning protein
MSAKQTLRLGRGLDSLIAAGAPRGKKSKKQAAVASPPPAPKAKGPGKPAAKSVVRPAAPAGSVVKAGQTAAKSGGKAAKKSAGKSSNKKQRAPRIGGTVPFVAKPPAEPSPQPVPPVPVAEPLVALPIGAAAAAPTLPPGGVIEVAIHQIVPNPRQPRRDFQEESLRELAESIRSEGLLQPVVVRRQPKGEGYELIAGERRWRACQSLKMKRIPARLVEASDASSAVLSLIENLQREDLNPIEEALGYASLVRDFALTQEAVAERVGKSRAAVANALRLLQLDREMQGYLAKGLLSVGHAKVLLGVEHLDTRQLLARQVIEKGWSVRETERQIAAADRSATGGHATQPGRVAPQAELTAIRDLERQLASALSTRVQLRHAPRRGKIIIEYHGNDDLQRIMERIGIA